MKAVEKKILLLLFVCAIQIISFAAPLTYYSFIPDVPNPPRLVNDFAHLLNKEEEFQLEKKLIDFNNETSNEITIVTVETLHDLEPYEYAYQLGNKWKIGKVGKKNGVLLLVSISDRKMHIAAAPGLQGVMPDIVCGKIIRENITPYFRTQNYFAGLNEGVDKIISATKGEFINDKYGQVEEISPFTLLLIFILFGFIVFVFFYSIRNRKNIYVSRRGYTYDDTWSGFPRNGGGWFNSGSWGDSGGSSSGGGFGGFGGGGGFDGGGASGSW